MWWSIEFTDGSFGYQKMEEGTCVGVFKSDGTVIEPNEIVEYTTVDTNASAPSWA